ncbi:phage holin family protein [Georgenia sunbinii]|uniref:phage holin family protein n=1 Tax=Georgenia sunbinii TaxID=3117728 RepID=UPI002F26204A
MGFILRLIINGVAIWLSTLLLSGVTVADRGDGWDQVLVIAVIALIFTLVNLVIKPVVSLFALPLTIITLGLFTLVVNALMVLLTSWLSGFTEFGLHVDGFWWALAAGVIISLASWLLNALLPSKR